MQRNITFNKLQPKELKFQMNNEESDVKSMGSEEQHMLKGHQNRMEKESRTLDSGNYFGKVHNLEARKLVQSQNKMISSIVSRPDNNAMIQIEYFDTLLNLERKTEHFAKLFNKIKLRVIHKPFIILDMLKIMTDDRSGVSIFGSFLKKLLNMRKRQAVDRIIDFVEHKKEVINKWGGISRKLIKVNKQKKFQNIENQQIEKQKIQRRLQKNKRGLRFLGTILNNFFREYKRNIWTGFVRKVFSEDSKWTPKETSFHIMNQQGFLLAKEKKPIAVGSSERNYQKGQKDENDESSFNNNTFEVRGNQMNAYYHNGKTKGSLYNSDNEEKPKKKREFESSFEDLEEGGLQRMQMALNSGNIDSGKLLVQIKNEIDKIQRKLDQDESNEKVLSFGEKIDMLSQLMNLMQLIKKYYESFKDDTEESQKINKKNFEQVLVILQRVISRLLHKMPNDVGLFTKSQNEILNKENGSLDEEKQAEYETYHNRVEELNKMMNKEVTGIVNLISPKLGMKQLENEEDFETEKNQEFEENNEENEDVETGDGAENFGSITGINQMLAEMTQSLNLLGQMNSNQRVEQNGELSIFICIFFNFKFPIRVKLIQIKWIPDTRALKNFTKIRLRILKIPDFQLFSKIYESLGFNLDQ